MKWVICSAVILGLALYGNTEKEEAPLPPPHPPFDADLFRKDAQITSLTGEFLYWTVQEGALDYALKMTHSAWGPDPSYAQGRYETAKFDMAPGIRVGFLYFRAPHYWEVRSSYTWLACDGDNRSSKPKPTSKFLTGTWPQPAGMQPLSGAKSHIRMNYNVFDFMVTRNYYTNPHLRLRLLGGFVVSWIHQNWQVIYDNSLLQSNVIRNQWRFIGAGLQSGFMVDWYWGNNVYITGSTMLGALMGSYSNRTEQTVHFQPSPDDNPNIPVRDTVMRDIRPATTLSFAWGPSWQKNFCAKRMEVFLGYELIVWYNVHEVYRSTAGRPSDPKETRINNSAMALQVITTRYTIDF